MLRLPIAVIQLMHHQKACKWLQLVTIGVSLILPSSLARAQTFGIYRQLWTGLSTTDGSINALTNTLQNPNWPNNPNSAYTQIFTDFETEFNFLEGYGQRLRAFVVPPTTGYYTFWISSADNSSLFLSTDEGVTNRQLLCYVVNSTNPREWNKELNQMSSPVALEGGRRYYLEVLHKEANGGDNLAVRWQLPNGVMEEPLTSSSPSG